MKAEAPEDMALTEIVPPWLVEAVGGLPSTVEEAYRVAVNVTPAARALYRLRDHLQRWIAEDMYSRDATERVVDGVRYTFQSEGDWSVADDSGFMNALGDLLDAGELTQAEFQNLYECRMVPQVKWDHRKLTSLLKRGEKVRSVIESHRRKSGAPVVRVKE